MRSVASFTALHRFGTGAGPGDDARVGDDPRGWLHAQIRPGAAVPDALGGFRSSADILAAISTARFDGPEARQAAIRLALTQDARPEILARAALSVAPEGGLGERMVQFWSNHFTVSGRRARYLAAMIPAYEREAIRPHVFGRFADMLRAVARHPAMLTYLDNPFSIGPDSPAGQRRRAETGARTTLNENFARELLELHTLGVGGGYTQEDVIELALALTGWSHGGYRRGGAEAVHGAFQFVRRQHQPGDRVLLGRRYPETGQGTGLAILDDLARHPATATHLATRLARHFIADDPPEAAVQHLARVFLDSEGDLAQVTAALIDLDACWADPLAKVKTPWEYLIALHRAAGHRPPARRELFEPLAILGMTPFDAPSPQGWGDRAADWLTPEALMIRVEWAHALARRLPPDLRPMVVLDDAVGAVARPQTAAWVSRAPSVADGLALVLASPEIQRR